VYLAIIEARYDYQMSYLVDWRMAWEKIATKILSVNLVSGKNLNILSKEFNSFDLVVMLHSGTADSNVWLQKLLKVLPDNRSTQVVLFVGNEFSSPWLSTDDRLNSISNLNPDILASQLTLETAEWLYAGRAKKVVSSPPGIPEQTNLLSSTNKLIDFSYRGFVYPWYLLDKERNSIVDMVLDHCRSLNLNVDFSQSNRLSKFEWQNLLSKSRFTASTEAGSRYVFRDDQVWQNFKEYLFRNPQKSISVTNDANGMVFLRRLPHPMKKTVRKILNFVGVTQGSLYKPSSDEEEIFLSLISPHKFEHKDGKCLSSRHFDAIASNTWQILAPGAYNGVLKPNVHYSELNLDGHNIESIIDISLNAFEAGLTTSAFEDLISDNSYDARVRLIRSHLR
jgi:hypothetical protein